MNLAPPPSGEVTRDRPAHRVGDAPRDREPEARPARPVARGAVEAGERLEDALARPRAGCRGPRPRPRRWPAAPPGARARSPWSRRRRVVHRVVDEDQEQLDEPVAVGASVDRRRRPRAASRDTALGGERGRAADRVARERRGVERDRVPRRASSRPTRPAGAGRPRGRPAGPPRRRCPRRAARRPRATSPSRSSTSALARIRAAGRPELVRGVGDEPALRLEALADGTQGATGDEQRDQRGAHEPHGADGERSARTRLRVCWSWSVEVGCRPGRSPAMAPSWVIGTV